MRYSPRSNPFRRIQDEMARQDRIAQAGADAGEQAASSAGAVAVAQIDPDSGLMVTYGLLDYDDLTQFRLGG